MRALGVVLVHPPVQRCLQFTDGGEHAVGVAEELRPHRLMKALNLSRRGGRARRGQQMPDPVLHADPIEQHFRRRTTRPEPPGEHLPVISQDLLGHAVAVQRTPAAPHIPGARWPARPPSPTPRTGSCHQSRSPPSPPPRHPGEPRRRRPSATTPSADPAPTACSRCAADGAWPDRYARYAPTPDTHWNAPAPHHTFARQLIDNPGRTPARVSIAQHQHPRLQLRRHLMRTPMRTRRPILQIQHRPLTRITAQPRMHRLPRHPIATGNSADHRPIQDLQHRPITHLGHPQLPQHAGPFRSPPTTTKEPTTHHGCKAPTGTVVADLPEPRPRTVKHQPELKRQA